MNAGDVIQQLMEQGDAALAEEREATEYGQTERAEFHRGVRHGITKAIAIVATAAVAS